MSPSSTSSSDRTRGWGHVALLVLVVLAATEALLRVPSVRAALPARTHYYHRSIAERLDDLDRVQRKYGRVDVLFTGSSIVRTDVHPHVFDAALDPHTNIISFNVAMDGIWPGGVELYTRHLWLDAARPRLVIQGIRYPELRVTTPAKHHTQIWTGTVESGWGEDDIFTRLESQLANRLHLLQYRGILTDEMQRYLAGRPGAIQRREAIRGYVPRPAPRRRVETMTADLPNDGTCQGGACDAAFAAIRRTRDTVREAGADYMLFNVPEHGSRWRGRHGVARYREYLRAVRTFAGAEGIPFVDVTGGDPFRFDAPHAFSDLSHMTAAASLRFTEALAREARRTIVAAIAQPEPERRRPRWSASVPAASRFGS